MDDVFIYTTSDDSYFLGLVALINSLEINQHYFPIIVGDCGLSDPQRKLLFTVDRVQIISLNRSLVRNPQHFKPFAHLLHEKGVAIIIDSDMIVVDSLEPLIAEARNGKFCTFANPSMRWFPEWQEIFHLAGPPRQQPYFCTGFQAFSAEHFPTLLEEWWEACRLIRSHPTYQEGADAHDCPTSQSDQDALNAVMMSAYPETAIHWAPFNGQVHRHSLRDVRVRDKRTLRCDYRAQQPAILHASFTPKPWTRAGVTRNAFDVLLRRLLTGSDVALKIPSSELEPFLSLGLMGWWHRHRAYLANMGVGPLLLSYAPRRAAGHVRRLRMAVRSWCSAQRDPMRQLSSPHAFDEDRIRT